MSKIKYQSLTGRTYCLDCSPFGSRNGYKLRKENTRQGKDEKQCPICKKSKTKADEEGYDRSTKNLTDSHYEKRPNYKIPNMIRRN